MSNILDQDDFVQDGFARVPDEVFELRPPKIQWGKKYLAKTMEERLEYLEKFASTMNQAAARIQDEREKLNALCENKEKQIVSMKKAVEQNMAMLQSEMTKLNEDRQHFLAAIADLKAKLRAHGDHC